MTIPTVAIDSILLKALTSYETARQLIRTQDVPIAHMRRIEDGTILKSSLFSARIEGNILDESTLEHAKDEDAKREIYNLIDAIGYIKHIPVRTHITRDTLRHLHAIVMKDLSADAGHLRNEQNAIFDASGGVRYLPPPPITMRKDLDSLIEYANHPAEFPIINALISHLVFEKIHPFVDGNGRVGRLLIHLVLRSQGEDYPYIVPFERYLDTHRELYYRHIDTGMQDSTGYILFMLEALTKELSALHDDLELQDKNARPYLPPRREEILRVIQDHPYITMDGIHRRFLGVPIRTLRYDIAQLMRMNHIHKIGTTKGTSYIVRK